MRKNLAELDAGTGTGKEIGREAHLTREPKKNYL